MRFLNNGIAVPSQDTHLGPWVEQANKLCHDPRVEAFAAQYLKAGDVVVDGGANIGDHTIAYCQAVGPSGLVLAFEPNPEALACCAINCLSAVCLGAALWSEFVMIPFHIVVGNVGSSHIFFPTGETPVFGMPLDAFKLERLNLLKLDVEGAECDALMGAIETIDRCRPVILAEINHAALERCKRTYQDILGLLVPFSYRIELWDRGCGLDGVQSDVIFLPT